jgi:hypothetical protein
MRYEVTFRTKKDFKAIESNFGKSHFVESIDFQNEKMVLKFTDAYDARSILCPLDLFIKSCKSL